MAPNAPITPTQPTVTATDKPSVRRTPTKVTVARSLLGTVTAAYASYSGWVLGGMAYAGWERAVPPQANHVILTTLAVMEVAAILYLLHVHRSRRSDDDSVIVNTRLSAAEKTLAEVRALLTTSRGTWDDPTVPNVTSRARGVYRASSAVNGGRVQSHADIAAVVDLVLARLPLKEMLAEEYMRGAQSTLDLLATGTGGNVRVLPHPRP